jgi:ssDNA-binding Zn-finger/Zn-ribbon topoisomerase 1
VIPWSQILALIEPMCPKCGAPMQQRVTKQGKFAGRT